MYIKLKQSFTNIYFKIKNIDVNNDKITITYNFEATYKKYRYYLDNSSNEIIPNNQTVYIYNEIMELTLNKSNKKINEFKIINDENEYSGLELLYYKLLEVSDCNDIKDSNSLNEYLNKYLIINNNNDISNNNINNDINNDISNNNINNDINNDISNNNINNDINNDISNNNINNDINNDISNNNTNELLSEKKECVKNIFID